MPPRTIDTKLIAKAMQFHENRVLGALGGAPAPVGLPAGVDALTQPLIASWAAPVDYEALGPEAMAAIDEFFEQGESNAAC